MAVRANLLSDLADGDAGIETTLWAMKAFIDDAVESGRMVHQTAAAIAAAAGLRDVDQLQAVYAYLVKHFRFKRDPVDIEYVQHPDKLIYQIATTGTAAGDCDDLATLGGSLLRALGFRAVLIVVSTRPNGDFHHVLFGAYLGNELITLDPQQRMYNQLPATITRKLVFEL